MKYIECDRCGSTKFKIKPCISEYKSIYFQYHLCERCLNEIYGNYTFDFFKSATKLWIGKLK